MDSETLIVQYEYSAVNPEELSVVTHEKVKHIRCDGKGWVLVEKDNGKRGLIPEDWVVTSTGGSVSDLESKKQTMPQKKLSSASQASKEHQMAKAARKRKVVALKAKLEAKQKDLEKKQKALEDLEQFLLENQTASESARMAMVEEDDFWLDDEEELDGFGDDLDVDEEDDSHESPGMQRANVVKEIFESEHSYCQDLAIIVEQFLQPLSQRAEIFNPRVLEILFSNILEVLTMQKGFLKELENSIGIQPSFKSEIGKVFEAYSESFKLYAVYCANHTRASDHLDLLQGNEEAYKILEACRLLCAARSDGGQQPGIGLGGYLLTPVQRICKYPLLLRELLKATPVDHPDYAAVEGALERMTVVAQSINEDKRNTEHLIIIQQRISGWKGPPLVETSSTLVYEGILQKISNGKCQERLFYLFDNLLVYCKRTSGGKQIFRGRIPTDCLSVKAVADGKFEGKSFSNGMMFENPAKNTSYVVFGKDASDKSEWLKRFEEERSKVAADSAAGIDRRSRERLNTAATTSSTGINRSRGQQFRSAKNKKNSVELSKGVNETAEQMKQSAERVAQFKPVDVRLSISRDCISWAGKNSLLFPRSRIAVIQEILDKFMCSHLNAEDFELVQITSDSDVVLPDDPIPLFAMDKSCTTPFELYLHHIASGRPSHLAYPDDDDI